jgi:AraC-like DNA-binding protein
LPRLNNKAGNYFLFGRPFKANKLSFMNLSFHPAHPEFPGKKLSTPASWAHYLAPWSTAIYTENDFGSVLIQELVCRNFGIFIWTLDVRKAICLYPTAKTPTIAIQFTLEGNIPCILKGFGNKLLEKGNYEMFYVPIGLNEAWFEPGLYESLHIELQPAYLEELTNVRPEIKELISRLQTSSNKGLPMAEASTNYITATIIQNLRACDKNEAALQLEMHKYILEVLCEYLAAILQNEENESRKNISHKDLMLRVKNHILSAPNIHDHSLNVLAESFGVSHSILKRNFKAFYAVGVSEYVRIQVLARAHYLLATTKRSVEDIAEEVGYANREALERAFKKQYSYSPSNLRTDLN